MGLARRAANWSSAAVLFATFALGVARLASWALELGFVAEMALWGGALLFALGMAQVAGHRGVRPTIERLHELTVRIRGQSGRDPTRISEIDDSEIAPLAGALNTVLDAVREERDRALSEAELMDGLVQRSPHGVLIADAEGRVQRINPSLRELIDLRGVSVGRKPIEVVPVAEVQEIVDRVRSGELVDEVPVVVGRRDLLLRAIPLESGYTAVLVEDVSRFKAAERARSDFVANVSHELRTPIASIMGYAETIMAESERLEPDVEMMVSTIHRNGERLRDIFEDLLQLARIEARSEALELREQRLFDVLAEAVAPAADRAMQRSQSFELQCSESLLAYFHPEALTTIVANLAINASKYTPAGGHVWVRAFAEDDRVVIEVQDDGHGIDKGQQQRIFERFFRVDAGRSRDVGGTGLGLSIAKHLAIASQAHLEVHSAIGEGSVFRLVLPARPGPPA